MKVMVLTLRRWEKCDIERNCADRLMPCHSWNRFLTYRSSLQLPDSGLRRQEKLICEYLLRCFYDFHSHSVHQAMDRGFIYMYPSYFTMQVYFFTWSGAEFQVYFIFRNKRRNLFSGWCYYVQSVVAHVLHTSGIIYAVNGKISLQIDRFSFRTSFFHVRPGGCSYFWSIRL